MNRAMHFYPIEGHPQYVTHLIRYRRHHQRNFVITIIISYPARAHTVIVPIVRASPFSQMTFFHTPFRNKCIIVKYYIAVARSKGGGSFVACMISLMRDFFYQSKHRRTVAMLFKVNQMPLKHIQPGRERARARDYGMSLQLSLLPIPTDWIAPQKSKILT